MQEGKTSSQASAVLCQGNSGSHGFFNCLLSNKLQRGMGRGVARWKQASGKGFGGCERGKG